MKLLSEKETMCTSIKILITKDDDKNEIINHYRSRGFHHAKKPIRNNYNQGEENAIKYTREGSVHTLVKYEPMPDWSR